MLSSRNAYELGRLDGKQRTAKALRQSQEELRQLSTRLLIIQEWERQRIAADLHDGIGQSLSLIKLSIESLIQQLKGGGQQAAERSMQESLEQLTLKINETMAELRRTAMDLRPSMLDDLGIIPTLQWFMREFSAVWHGNELVKEIDVRESQVPGPLKTVIFRILQEAINNIAKHADANSIRVSLKAHDGQLRLLIEDDGVGFDTAGMARCGNSGRGMGLLTMRERARASNGAFVMKSVPGDGTRILVSWQLAEGGCENDPC